MNCNPAVPADLNTPNPAAAPAGDGFSLSDLRLSQDFSARLGVKKKLVTVPVRKPDKTWFFRTHPDQARRTPVLVIELKDEGELYLVHPSLTADPAIEAVASYRLLVQAVNRQGVAFIIPARLPGPDGRLDAWGQSLLEGIELARDRWVRVASNKALGAYEVFEATSKLSEPVWPEESFEELLKVAFRDRVIQDRNHPVLRKLRGEV